LKLDRNLANARGQIDMAKVQLDQAKDTEIHIQAALRLSPRDAFAYQWCSIAGRAKLYLGEEEAAIAWLRRSIETSRNYSMSHFFLAAALGRLGLLPEACSEARTGLAINPTFQHPSISRQHGERQSDCGRRTGAHH
jgi:tetratricopeptide (TPR) repeat protein